MNQQINLLLLPTSTTSVGIRAGYTSYNMAPRRDQRVTPLEEVYGRNQIAVLEERFQNLNGDLSPQYVVEGLELEEDLWAQRIDLDGDPETNTTN